MPFGNGLIGDIADHRRIILSVNGKKRRVAVRGRARIAGRKGDGLAARPVGRGGADGGHIIGVDGNQQIRIAAVTPGDFAIGMVAVADIGVKVDACKAAPFVYGLAGNVADHRYGIVLHGGQFQRPVFYGAAVIEVYIVIDRQLPAARGAFTVKHPLGIIRLKASGIGIRSVGNGRFGLVIGGGIAVGRAGVELQNARGHARRGFQGHGKVLYLPADIDGGVNVNDGEIILNIQSAAVKGVGVFPAHGHIGAGIAAAVQFGHVINNGQGWRRFTVAADGKGHLAARFVPAVKIVFHHGFPLLAGDAEAVGATGNGKRSAALPAGNLPAVSGTIKQQRLIHTAFITDIHRQGSVARIGSGKRFVKLKGGRIAIKAQGLLHRLKSVHPSITHMFVPTGGVDHITVNFIGAGLQDFLNLIRCQRGVDGENQCRRG